MHEKPQENMIKTFVPESDGEGFKTVDYSDPNRPANQNRAPVPDKEKLVVTKVTKEDVEVMWSVLEMLDARIDKLLSQRPDLRGACQAYSIETANAKASNQVLANTNTELSILAATFVKSGVEGLQQYVEMSLVENPISESEAAIGEIEDEPNDVRHNPVLNLVIARHGLELFLNICKAKAGILPSSMED